jgi:hypothetical protein
MPNDHAGYGKPPKHSRFKPGQSGNPKGRPKGRIPLARLLEKHLDAKMTVTIGGQQKTITRREALIIGFVGDALKGKDRVRKQVLDLLLLLEAQNPPDTSDATSHAQDDAIIKGLLERYGLNPPVAARKSPKTSKTIKAKNPELLK